MNKCYKCGKEDGLLYVVDESFKMICRECRDYGVDAVGKYPGLGEPEKETSNDRTGQDTTGFRWSKLDVIIHPDNSIERCSPNNEEHRRR